MSSTKQKTFAKGETPQMGLRSRSQRYRQRRLFEKLKANKPAKKVKAERAAKAEPKYVPLYADKKRIPSRRNTKHPVKIRKSLVPGAVLILLAGKYQAKRVVLLKVYSNGLLLVSGPYAVNGVPLRRVNAAYVIATSTTVDISAIDVNVDESLFKKSAAKKPAGKKADEEKFFAAKKGAKKSADPAFLEAQKKIDTQLLAAIAKVPLLKGYLRSTFSLSSGDKPHLMRF